MDCKNCKTPELEYFNRMESLFWSYMPNINTVGGSNCHLWTNVAHLLMSLAYLVYCFVSETQKPSLLEAKLQFLNEEKEIQFVLI